MNLIDWGGNETIKVDVRVIAATNKNLAKEIELKEFRDDLYYRLNVINIYVPRLSERKEDIPVITDYFLQKYCEENGIPKKYFTRETTEFLQSLPWKGNIRELENLVKRTTILIKSPEIMLRDLLAIMESADKPMTQQGQFTKKGLQEATDEFQKEYILKVLAENNWNKTKAAEELKVERPNLHRKLKDLGIST